MVGGDGVPGWAWRFDPHMWERSTRTDLTPVVRAARCALALVRGEKSRLFHAEDATYLLSLIAPGAPYVEIPEAEHHVMIDQPLGFVAALRALLAAWPAAEAA
jgi:pimeloyl-ACP methyl ester carboxylesterase